MDSHQSMLARSNPPCLPWAAPQQLRTATQLHATTSDTCEELKRKHCVKKVLCLGAQCTPQKPSAWGLPWHCPRLCGLVSWLCTEWVVSKQSSKSPSYFEDWRFIHQQPFKSFKSSKSFYGPCRHVGLKGLLTICSSQTGLAGPGFSGVWHYVDVPSIVCPGGPGRMDGGLRRMSWGWLEDSRDKGWMFTCMYIYIYICILYRVYYGV